MKQSEAQARKRTEIFIKVQSGQLTPTEAAEVLGISRKTYYEWEKRGLAALVNAMTNRSPGRPSKTVDPEKEKLEKSLSEMEKEMLLQAQRAEIRDYYLSPKEISDLAKARQTLTKKKRQTGPRREADGDTETG